MRTTPLPGTDLHLSVIGFGGWTIGGTWWGPDQDDDRAVRTVHAALAHGMNWVDTAPLYGHGHADRLVARALTERPEVLVATKVGVRWDGPGAHAVSDLSPAHLRADCEASLRRLGRDRIDLLQVHWPCERGTPLAASLGALQDLVAGGKVRAIGLCNYDATTLARARARAPIATVQTPLSLLRREYEGGLQAECTTVRGTPPRPCPALVYETLCRGLLTGKYRSLPTFDASDMRARDDRFSGRRFAHARGLLDDLGRVADKVGVPMAALATGWALARPGVGAAIVGFRSPQQVAEGMRAAELVGRARLWRVVDRIAALHGGT